MSFDGQSPNPLDVHIGQRVRLRRKFVGMTQDDLAGTLNLSFQQIQKYETGATRISATKIFEISKLFGVAIEWFFEGFERTDVSVLGSDIEQTVLQFLMTAEGVELATAFLELKGPKKRRKILELIRAINDEGDV